MVPAFDCYQGYGRINWKLVAASGVRAVWIKCGEGNEPARDDTAYRRNVDEARANGIAVGAYFFAYPLPHGPGKPVGRSPIEQAGRFFEITGGLGSRPGELSPAFDFEWPPPEEWKKWGCEPEQLSDWGREFCEAVTLLWGRLPVIYTYPWWWKALSAGADVEWAGRYPLWMASYTHPGPGIPPEGKAPPVPAPWRDWAVWQYSADGSKERVPGVPVSPVDRDVVKDEETLRSLMNERVWDPDADTQPSVRPPVVQTPDFATVTRLPGAIAEDDDEPPPKAA